MDNSELSALRRRMDRVNRQMLALFLERMDVVKRIGGLKKEAGIPVFDPGREEKTHRFVKENVPEDMEEYAQRLFSFLMHVSKEYQMKERGEDDEGQA